MAHFTDSWDSSRYLGYLNPGNVPPTDDPVTHGPSVSDALTSRHVEPHVGRTAECRPRFHESIKWATASAHAIEVVFINERRYGWTQEQVAHCSTGRNRTSGKLTLAIGVRRRPNGLVRFDGDLWRLDLDLHPDTITRIADYWDRLNRATPMKTQTRMERHFSRTFLQFDAMREQTDDWKDFLRTVLSDAGSYVGLDHWKGSPR